MTRKVLWVLLIVLMLLSVALLTACETAGAPQPTATAKPATPESVTPLVIPTRLEGYPTINAYP